MYDCNSEIKSHIFLTDKYNLKILKQALPLDISKISELRFFLPKLDHFLKNPLITLLSSLKIQMNHVQWTKNQLVVIYFSKKPILYIHNYLSFITLFSQYQSTMSLWHHRRQFFFKIAKFAGKIVNSIYAAV